MQAIHNLNLASLLDTFISVATAFILGSLIGLERQIRQRTAGLRTTAGIAPSELASRFGRPFETVYGPLARQLRDWGLLEVEPARDVIRLTNRGLLLGNEVFARFLPD